MRTSRLAGIAVGVPQYIKKGGFCTEIFDLFFFLADPRFSFLNYETKKRPSGENRDNSNETDEKNESEHRRKRNAGTHM